MNKCSSRRRVLILTLLILLLAILCRIEREAYGVWRLSIPGVSITTLRDYRLGPVLWIYWLGEYQGKWTPTQGEWEAVQPIPYPTSTPYPTATPYPTPRPRAPLQGT